MIEVGRLIATLLGCYGLVIVALLLAVRVRWVYQTYGSNYGFVDWVESAATPTILTGGAIVIALCTYGLGGVA